MPLCLPPLFRSASRSDRSEDLKEGGNRRLRRRAAASALFATAFAAVDAASQVVGRVQRATGLLQEGSFNPVRLLVALVLSGAACWGLLALVDLAARRRGRDSQEAGAQPGAGWRDRRRLALLAFLIPLICWSLLYAHLWPMASMNDTAWILRDPIGAGAQHPITYGLSIGVLFRLGRLVGGDLTGVVLLSVGQMLLWAACVSGVALFLDRKGASRRVTGLLIAYCALMPLVADYSFAVVKDAAFSLFTTLLIPVLLVVRASAGQVLLVALEPEDECGAMFLRLRKAVRKSGLKVATVAPFTSNGSRKMNARLLHAAPGAEPGVVDAIKAGGAYADVAEALSGGVVLVGERAARVPGLLSSVVALAERTGARLAWVPRRAGDRAAIEAGLLPGLLPFGRGIDEAGAQSLGWGELPERGLDAKQMIEAAASGKLKALVVGGVDVRDFDEPAAVRDALDEVPFLVSLEVRASEITDRADVVLPVAPAVEKNGTYINWEGRLRPFGQARSATSLTDRDVLVRLAEEFDADLGITTLSDLYAEVNPLMEWDGDPQDFTPASAQAPAVAGKGQVVLASHKPMIDAGRLQDGAPWLAGSARRPVLLASAATLAAAGITPGADATLETERGTITLPAAIADLPDSVAWVPECSTGSVIHENLGGVGTVATLRATQEVAR